MKFLIIQLIGAIGFGILMLSYHKKEKKQILLMQIIAYLIFTLHFYLLNGITGAMCNFLGFLALTSIYFSNKLQKLNEKIIVYIFVVGIIVINLITYQNIFTIFPIIAAVIAIISFLMEDENEIRKIGIISTLCWLVYAVVYKSYISIIFELTTLISVFIAYIKNTKTAKT